MSAPEAGRSGEDTAACWLEHRGYTILTRNFRVREGEIDIVALQGNTVVFVEVKWRRNTRFAAPGESVSLHKQARLRQAAALWMAANGEQNARFDVIEIVQGLSEIAPRIHHIVDAFI